MRLLHVYLVLVLLACGCLCFPSGPACHGQYFEYKTGECCLDSNGNQICDSDETLPLESKAETSLTTTTKITSTTMETTTLRESSTTIPSTTLAVASSTTILQTPACTTNGDCGMEENYTKCREGNVVMYYERPRCIHPGTPEAYCTLKSDFEAYDKCNSWETCVDGRCVNESALSCSDACDGEGYSAWYCNSGDSCLSGHARAPSGDGGCQPDVCCCIGVTVTTTTTTVTSTTGASTTTATSPSTTMQNTSSSSSSSSSRRSSSSSSSRRSTTTTTCADSDSGLDYYHYGIVSVPNQPGLSDYCANPGVVWCGSASSQDFCVNCYAHGGRVKAGEAGCWCDSTGVYINAWAGSCPTPASPGSITWCGTSKSQDFCMNCYLRGGRVKSGEAGCWCDSTGVYINAWAGSCPRRLTEYYCLPGGPASSVYDCPHNICQNGECKNAPA